MKGKAASSTPHYRVTAEFGRSLSGLGQLAQESPEDFHSLRVYQRGAQDVLAVVKRYGPAGDVEVLFGSGTDFVGALLSASAAVDNGRWRVDKPYTPK